MRKNNPYIVLVRPQLPENIGMVARAMNNCGLNKLILVSPREKWPNEKAINSSANSKIILSKIKIFSSLKKALSSFNYIVATSNRNRFLHKPTSNIFLELFKKIPITKKVAFVFGPENSGLSNDDLMLCDSIFNIKLPRENRSLNLSHAVLLICYKWNEYFNVSTNLINSDNTKTKIATKKDFQFFMDYLKKELNKVGYLYPKHKNHYFLRGVREGFLNTFCDFWRIFIVLIFQIFGRV